MTGERRKLLESIAKRVLIDRKISITWETFWAWCDRMSEDITDDMTDDQIYELAYNWDLKY